MPNSPKCGMDCAVVKKLVSFRPGYATEFSTSTEQLYFPQPMFLFCILWRFSTSSSNNSDPLSVLYTTKFLCYLCKTTLATVQLLKRAKKSNKFILSTTLYIYRTVANPQLSSYSCLAVMTLSCSQISMFHV